MKQTNNAIKFLMAQYRSIFKNAYFKGLSTAVVLTAGLAAASGVQASFFANANSELSSNDPIFITGAPNDSGDGNKWTALNISYPTNAISAWNNAVTINAIPALASPNSGNYINGSGSITGTGTLTINGNNAGLILDANGSADLSLSIKEINVANGELIVSGSSSGSTAIAEAINVGSQGQITLKGDTSKVATLGGAGSVTTLDGTLILQGTTAVAGAVVSGTIAGTGTLKFESSGGTIAAITGEEGSDLNITVASGADALLNNSAVFQTNGLITLGDAAGGGSLTIQSGTLAVSEGTTFDAKGGEIVFNGTATGDAILAGKLSGNVAPLSFSGNKFGTISANTDEEGITANITVNSGSNTGAQAVLDLSKADGDTFKVASGTITLVGNTTSGSGAKFTIQNGTLELGSGASLAASGAIVTPSDGLILDSSATTEDAVLKLSTKQIIDFLSGDGTNTGAIALTNGTIYLTDESSEESPLDLAASTFVSGAAYFGSSTGQINVGADGVLASEYLLVKKDLDGSLNGLTLKADQTLTLGGDETFDSDTTGIGVKELQARNVIFQQDNHDDKESDRTFNLRDNLTLSAVSVADDTGYVSAEEGTISGDVIVTNAKTFKLAAGTYNNTYKLTLSGGSLAVGGAGNGVNASLVQTGDLTLNGGSITVSGNGTQPAATLEDGTTDPNPPKGIVELDITGANLTLVGTGSSNALSAADATIKVTGDQAREILGQDAEDAKYSAQVTLHNGGILDVDGIIRGVNGASIDVSKIGANGSNIKFAGEGQLIADEIWLKANKQSDALNLSSGGEIVADLLRLDTITKSDNVTYNDFTVKGGTLTVGETLDSFSSIGSALALNGTNLNLGWYDSAEDHSAAAGSVQQALKLSNSATLAVNYGDWTANDVELNKSNLVIGESDADIAKGYETSLTGKALKLDNGSTAQVEQNGTATFDSMSLVKGNNALTVAEGGNVSTSALSMEKGGNTVYVLGEMAVSGTESAETNHGIAFGANTLIKVEGANAKLSFGDYAVQNITVNEDSVELASGSFIKNIDITKQGTLALAFAEGTEFNEAAIKSLRKQLLLRTDDAALPESHIDLGDARIVGLDADENGFISWKQYENFSDISDIKTNSLKDATLKDVNDKTKINVSVGNIMANKGVNEVLLSNATLSNSGLHNDNRNFVFADGAPENAINAKVLAGTSATLENGGNIGNVTLEAGSDVKKTELYVQSDGTESNDTTFAAITTNGNSIININGNTTVTGDLKGDDVIVGAGKNLTADNISLTGSLNSDKDGDNYLTAGELSAKTLSVTGSTTYVGDINVAEMATFGADARLAGNNTFKNVTFNGNALFENLNDTAVRTTTAEAISMATAGSTISVGGNNTGYLMADRIDLNCGVLQADPDYTLPASIVTTKFIGSAPADATADTTGAGVLNGTVAALRNSIIALGVDKQDADGKTGIEQVQGIFSAFLTEGKLDAENVGSILYVARTLDVKDGYKLVSNAAATYSDAALASITNDVYLGKNSALAINVTASPEVSIEEGDKDEEGAEGDSTKAAANTGAAINFVDKADANVFADEGSKIILVGDYNARKAIKLFNDTDGKVDFAEGSQDLTITSQSGKLTATIKAEDGVIGDFILGADWGNGNNNGGDVDKVRFAKASAPINATLEQYFNGDLPEDAFNPILNYEWTESDSDGGVAEKVARLGAFGGAAQAAIAAGSTTYEAVSGRMGVGANGTNITVADNTQGAALWLTPVYKNRDSDGFGADGVEYGTDLDLYGVALGADYTLANGVKIGAAFNIGSGDTDGNGAGDGVSNDFDYYGFAIYGGYTYGPYSVVADISYTNVDNDVEANTGITNVGKVGTSFNSSNLSVGVTGQYQAVLDGDVTVTPHAGLRYTKIDLDDYTVHGENGDVAAYSSDDLSIFSIPFGVTVAKEFVNGTWTVKPSFDLTLTANMGDDSADGSVNWGVDGLANTAVSSEVLDNFTYGATVGVAAKSNNFSLGFGLNYTGSSNTDEFGVNANARFVF